MAFEDGGFVHRPPSTLSGFPHVYPARVVPRREPRVHGRGPVHRVPLVGVSGEGVAGRRSLGLHVHRGLRVPGVGGEHRELGELGGEVPNLHHAGFSPRGDQRGPVRARANAVHRAVVRHLLHLDDRPVDRGDPAVFVVGIRLARVAVVVHVGSGLVHASGLLEPGQTHHREVVLVRDVSLGAGDCEERVGKPLSRVAQLVAQDVEGEARPVQLPRVQAVVDARVVLELLVGVHAVDAGPPHRGSDRSAALLPAVWFGHFF